MYMDVNLMVIHFPMFSLFFFFFSDIWYLLNIIQALTTLEKKKVELLSVNKSFLIVSESIYFPDQRWLVNTNVDFF